MVSNLARCGLPAMRTCTTRRALIPAPCSWGSSGYSWARQGPPVSAGPTWKALGDAAMIEKFPPPRVTIRRYAAWRVCDVVVVVRGQEMVICARPSCGDCHGQGLDRRSRQTGFACAWSHRRWWGLQCSRSSLQVLLIGRPHSSEERRVWGVPAKDRINLR